jgi:hypothetical protein
MQTGKEKNSNFSNLTSANPETTWSSDSRRPQIQKRGVSG